LLARAHRGGCGTLSGSRLIITHGATSAVECDLGMRRQRNNERGAVAVLAGILLIVIGGFLALSLNVGHKMLAPPHLPVGIDDAAMAAARALNGCNTTPCCPGCSAQPYGGVLGARFTAQTYAARHIIDGAGVSISQTADVTPGWWDGTTFWEPGQTVT